MLLRDLLCFGFRILVRARVRQSCCRQCNSDYTGHTRPAMRLRNVGLPPYICMYSLLAIISAHNVNVTNVRVITREDNVGGSFGYSGALYSSDIGTLDAMISAPNSNSKKRGDEKTGQILKFTNIFSTQSLPEETIFYPSQTGLLNGSNGEGFGTTTLVINSTHRLMCAPRWLNTTKIKEKSPAFLGRCVLVGPGSDSIQEFGPYSQAVGYFHHVPKNMYHKHVYWKGGSLFGFSADSDGSVVAVGTPGLLNAKGGVQVYDIASGNMSDYNLTSYISNLNATSYGYLGYSVKLGTFCNEGYRGVCVAVGGPTMLNFGQVQIIHWNKDDIFNKLIQEINGTQIWSSFGYCLGSVNINNNAYDELLVGAPLYTEWSNPDHVPDQGMVFLYHYDLLTKKYIKRDVTLDGSKQKSARFGSAMADIGDINLDGVSDLAVGAPGETDGAGSIYIYLGSLNGFVNVPSQRIQASQIKVPVLLKGFGFTISSQHAPLSNTYPVFAVSAVLTDTVVIFRCKPVVDVQVNLTASPNPIDLRSACSRDFNLQGKCFKVQFCLIHAIRGSDFQPVNFSIHYFLDTHIQSEGLKRVTFPTGQGTSYSTVKTTVLESASPNIPVCSELVVLLKLAQIQLDRFTPIEIKTTFQIQPTHSPDDGPLLDALKANNIVEEVTIKKECGSDFQCEVDLIVSATLQHSPIHTQWTDIIVNYTKQVVMKINIRNKNETAYGVKITAEVDSILTFVKSKPDVNCALESLEFNTTGIDLADTEKTLVTCISYEALSPKDELEFHIVFDINQTYINDDIIKKDLNAKVSTTPYNYEHSPEINVDDNAILLTGHVNIASILEISSISSPKEIAMQRTERKSDGEPVVTGGDQQRTPINVTHKFLVQNKGPSYLPRTEIVVRVPHLLDDRSELVANITVEMLTPSGKVQCTSSDQITSTTPDFPTTYSTTTVDWVLENKRRRRSVPNKCQDKFCFLKCEDGPDLCSVHTCEVKTDLQPNSHMELNVNMDIDLAKLLIEKEFNTLHFISDIEIKEPKHFLFKPWRVTQQKESVTSFHFVQPGDQVNIWIIIGSLMASLIVLAIVCVILWKVGFFKRTQRLELQKDRKEFWQTVQATKADLGEQNQWF
ncbi:integrin alpha-8-like isoform X1 [Biomphalaria glabrata]|uniref:Integrin alpha-8-like isoform X1 n=3 Tax=Biomphalaria glabrata TaxID=6526 RepID=A0A9U8EHT3_BIOGL|nr:integrin alpha-8-like isoform X1 [Biomphalaria glabrata]